MYETIIMAVSNVITGMLSRWSPKTETGNEQLAFRMAEIERRLDTELRRSCGSPTNLYLNQTLQLFFETIRKLNIQISIGNPGSNVVLNIRSCPFKQDIDQILNTVAQDVIDFETIKTPAEILNIPQKIMVEEIGASSTDTQFPKPSQTSTAQIMQQSKDRLQRRLRETNL